MIWPPPRPECPPLSPAQPQANSCSGKVAARLPALSSPAVRLLRGPEGDAGAHRPPEPRRRGTRRSPTREPSALGQMCTQVGWLGEEGLEVTPPRLFQLPCWRWRLEKNTCHSAPNFPPVFSTSRARRELRLRCEDKVPGQQLATFEGVVRRSCPAIGCHLVSSWVKQWGHPLPPEGHSCRDPPV